ncbi:MAG: AsmA-like C-terminal domain-containing protein, partial [candidate division NC10 bacterium]
LKTEALALGLTATVADLAMDFWPVEVKGLRGRLSVTGRLGQTLRRPGFTGQVSLRNVSFRGWRADSVEGPLEADPARVASRALRLSAARTTATLSGEARLAESSRKWGTWRDDLHLALRADLRGRLEDLAAWSQQDWPVAGPIVFQARLNGTPSALEGGGQVEMQAFRIGPERFEALRATLAFMGSELTVPRLTARRGGVPIQAEGAIDTDGRYRFSVLPVKLDVAMIPPLAAAGGKGAAVLRVRGAGKWPEPRLEGDVALTDTVFRELEVGNGSLGFALDGKQWRWELSLALGLKARGVAPLAGSGPLQAEVTATSVDLMPLLPGLQAQLPFPLTARADGRAALRGTLPGLRDLGSQIELTAAGQAGEVPWRTREPARLALEAGALRFEALDLVGPGLAVAIRGSVRPGERTDLDLSGHAPFAIVKPWVPPLADLRGAPDVRLSLVGPAGELRVVGRAELSRVDVKLTPVPIWLSIASGEVRFDNDGLQYKVREGAAAGGRLEGQGTGHRDGQRWRHTVDFRLDKAQMEPVYEQIQSDRRWASGDLFTRGSLAFETAPDQSALPTLRGRVSLALDGGSLSSYPALVRIFGLLGSIAQPYRLPDLTRERMPYRRIGADFDVRDGVMETKNLLLDSEVVRVSGVGKVMLADQTVDLDLAVRPLQVLEQGIRRIPLLGRLLPQEQSLVIAYFDMQGPWADPAISVAPVKSLSETVVDILLFLLKAPGRVISPNP